MLPRSTLYMVSLAAIWAWTSAGDRDSGRPGLFVTLGHGYPRPMASPLIVALREALRLAPDASNESLALACGTSAATVARLRSSDLVASVGVRIGLDPPAVAPLDPSPHV